MRLKVHKKLKTASLNSKFTGSYKKCIVSKSEEVHNILASDSEILSPKNIV